MEGGHDCLTCLSSEWRLVGKRRCCEAKGCAGLVKVCLAYEHGIMPGNLHFKSPNQDSTGLREGTLEVGTQSFRN